MLKGVEISPFSSTLQHSLEKVRQTILPTIIRYDGALDNNGQQETVLDHVIGMKKLSAHIRQQYPALAAAIHFDQVDIMADLHDSGEANSYGDLSRGRSDYDALRPHYDEYEAVYKQTHVFPLFEAKERAYVEWLDYRFEHREEHGGDKEGLMTRILDKAQPLDIFDRGLIVNCLRAAASEYISDEDFDAVVRENVVKASLQVLEPAKKLLDLLVTNPDAQQELQLFIFKDILAPMSQRGYEPEVGKAKAIVFGQITRRGQTPHISVEHQIL